MYNETGYLSCEGKRNMEKGEKKGSRVEQNIDKNTNKLRQTGRKSVD